MTSKAWLLHEWGKPSHPAIIFLHGFMGLGKDWEKTANLLSGEYYCLCPDLPGHGENPLDRQPGYESWAAALRDTIQSRNIKQVTLVGYSMGGRLALYFSLTYPYLVERLVLESANPGISDPAEREARSAWDIKNATRIQKKGLTTFLQEWYDMPLFASLKNIPGLKEELAHQRAEQDPGNMARIIRSLSPGRQPSLWDHLADLTLPTLLVAGQLDEKYKKISQDMAKMIPDSDLAILPACGHNAHKEDPEQFAGNLYNWLNSDIGPK